MKSLRITDTLRPAMLKAFRGLAPLGLSCLLLSGCGADTVLAGSAIASGIAIGAVGFLLGGGSEIEQPLREGTFRLELNKVKALHFQLRMPLNTSLNQEIHISASPAGIVEVQDPVINIGESIAGALPESSQTENSVRFHEPNLPRIKGLQLGKASIRVEALGHVRDFEVEVVASETS